MAASVESSATAGTVESPPPAPVEAELIRIQGLLQQGQTAPALSAADALLAQAPENRDLLYTRAVALRLLGRIEESLSALAALERLHPRFGRVHQERGHCYVALRDAPAAAAAFERAVALNPSLRASWSILAGLYRMLGRTDDAQRAAQQASGLAAQPPEVTTAFAVYADGDLALAEQLVRQFLQTHGDNVEAMRLLAQIGMEMDVSDDAELLLSHAVRIDPAHRPARYEYALALLKRHKHLEAARQIEQLLALDPTNRIYRTTFATIR